MNPVDILGYTATALLAIAFVPQALKVWQTKSVDDISTPTFTMVVISSILWITYGFLKSDMPLILVNVILFFTQGSVLICKLKYGKNSSTLTN